MKEKIIRYSIYFILISTFMIGCDKKDKQQEEILVGAAASLEPVMGDLQILYKEQNPKVKLAFTFGGSGTLEQQIREGAPLDVFFSAAEKQMDTLEKDELILEDTRVDLLENQIVLIVPKDSTLEITGFEDIRKASVIALGDPDSVPVGQYAKEIFDGLKITEEVFAKATFGKDVTEVLAWVSAGNAEAGVVYSTDAKLSEDIKIAAVASEESHSRVIYPAAVVKGSKSESAAKDFISFLGTKEAKEIFIEYGFKVFD